MYRCNRATWMDIIHQMNNNFAGLTTLYSNFHHESMSRRHNFISSTAFCHHITFPGNKTLSFYWKFIESTKISNKILIFNQCRWKGWHSWWPKHFRVHMERNETEGWIEHDRYVHLPLKMKLHQIQNIYLPCDVRNATYIC